MKKYQMYCNKCIKERRSQILEEKKKQKEVENLQKDNKQFNKLKKKIWNLKKFKNREEIYT